MGTIMIVTLGNEDSGIGVSGFHVPAYPQCEKANGNARERIEPNRAGSVAELTEEKGRRVRPAEASIQRSPSGLPTQYLAWRETGTHRLFVGQQWLGEGQRVFLHTHPVEEVLMFVSGRGIARLGDDEFSVEAGDVVVVPAGIVHGFRNDDPEPLRVLVIFPGNEFAATEFVEPTHDQSALHPASLPGLPLDLVERYREGTPQS